MKCRKQSHSMALFSPRVPTSRKVYPGRSRNTFVYWSFFVFTAGFEQGGGIVVLQVRVTDRFREEAGAAAKDEVWGVRQFRRKSRRCGYSDFDILCGEDRVRENCRRFGVLLATLLLAVPACWGMWSSRVYLTAAAPAQTQAETTAQLHEKKFLPGFAEDAWETASLDSKTELAKQLAAYELAMLWVPDGTEVTVQPLDEDRLGYYSAASRQIVLSRSVLESGTAQETMDTIAHEAFHVQQTYVVENIDWDDAATQAAYYDQARRWLRNDQNGYVSGDEDILSYYFQPVEIDARAYAAEETERLQGLIDKELQKET